MQSISSVSCRVSPGGGERSTNAILTAGVLVTLDCYCDGSRRTRDESTQSTRQGKGKVLAKDARSIRYKRAFTGLILQERGAQPEQSGLVEARDCDQGRKVQERSTDGESETWPLWYADILAHDDRTVQHKRAEQGRFLRQGRHKTGCVLLVAGRT